MGKVSNDGQKRLPEFQKFLLERKLVTGSASEFEYLLLLSRELEFINKTDFKSATAETIEIKKMLTSFFQKLKANC